MTMEVAASEIVRQAGNEGGWMAAALCLVGCTMVVGLIVLVRNLMYRQTETEHFIRTTMADVIDDNTLEKSRIRSVWSKHRCLADSDVAAIMGDKELEDDSLGEVGRRVMERRKVRAAKQAGGTTA